jgi:hypothetical protein
MENCATPKMLSRASLTALLFTLAPPDVHALQSETRVAPYPFDNPARFSESADRLPDLGSAASDSDFSTRLATIAKSIGEASQNASSDSSLGDQAGIWAFNHFRDEVASRVENEGRSMLSPYGNAEMSLQIDRLGNLSGSKAQLFTSWAEKYNYLTFSQVGVTQQDEHLLANIGAGQRWTVGNWLLGYNAFLDRAIDDGQQRASLGTEAWGDFLRFSANYYQPLGGWRNQSSQQQQRMARGYDITTQGYLPFYRHIGMSLSWERYLGNGVDLFNNGNRYDNPSALKFGLNYTPVPLVTLSASHKEGSGGQSQDQLGLKLNYRFGVALEQQLSASNVAKVRSLRGSRYDNVERSDTPVLEFRQRKNLSVFLATPPWQLNPGETLPLKLQVRASNAVKQVSWQGDTQALSLTPPANNSDVQGWSIIMPQWDSTPGASNEYRLSVTVEDAQQQRVTSNWITLKLAPPMTLQQTDNFDLLAPASMHL